MNAYPWLLITSLFLILPSASVSGGAPRVQFDVGLTVGCVDVTPPEFAFSNPGERLVEARLEISSLIQDGTEQDLLEYFYRLESPERTAQIVDYLPKTTLSSDYAGNICVERKQESSQSMGLSLSGTVEQYLKLNGTSERGEKNSRLEKFEQLPPLELLASSGTTLRGYGVYFKLKPSPRESLEGARLFSLILRVPRQWRGDYMAIHCEARGVERGVVRPLDEQLRCGSRDFIVALYLEGDGQAKAAAARYVAAEASLRQALAVERQPSEKRGWPPLIRDVGQILGSALAAGQRQADDPLPKQLRIASRNYAAAKADLHAWRGLSAGQLDEE